MPGTESVTDDTAEDTLTLPDVIEILASRCLGGDEMRTVQVYVDAEREKATPKKPAAAKS